MVVALVALVLAACGGGGGDGGDDDEEPTATATATPTATTGIPGAGSRPSPSPTPVPTPTPVPEPTNAVSEGEWHFLFVIVSNNCGGDPVVGTTFDFYYYFGETREPKDGYIADGEPFQLTHIGGTYVANQVFTWPTFTWSYPVDGGQAFVTGTWDTPHHGVGDLTESYDIGGGDTCTIFARDTG